MHRLYVQYQIYNICAIYQQILTNVGHRLGHQSGLDGSSGQSSAYNLNVLAFSVYFVFVEMDDKHSILTNIDSR